MILVIGTPDSGKSLYAENLAQELIKGGKKAYIATMIPYGKEGEKRVEKHRAQREGKGFITYEKPIAVGELISQLESEQIKYALLECVSNLVGNEIYAEENTAKSDEELVQLIVAEISMLDDFLDNLIVVTNVFEKSAEYDEETNRYIAITASVNERLKKLAKKYIEKQKDNWVVYENN